MKILMVIPARSGSVRLPHKNIKLLGDKPLICWTIDVALEAKAKLIAAGHECKVSVSTDSLEYQQAIRDYYYSQGMTEKEFIEWSWGEFMPFHRPSDISGDVDTGLVIKHAYEWWKHDKAGEKFDADVCITLQPTSPFRTVDDIVESVEAIYVTDALGGAFEFLYDCVFTARPVTEFPQWMFMSTTEGARTWLGIPNRFLSGYIAQDIPELWIPNGAVYVTKSEFIQQGRIYGDTCDIVAMKALHSVDIEELEDFDLAEWLLETGKVKA